MTPEDEKLDLRGAMEALLENDGAGRPAAPVMVPRKLYELALLAIERDQSMGQEALTEQQLEDIFEWSIAKAHGMDHYIPARMYVGMLLTEIDRLRAAERRRWAG